ncbi:unnamed protein product [Trifolium pratense]|uniref:Uncharacterized protein n=1 Tax=Trifolium pratense TaxID=57577 RepID=A0ACB0J6P0_TRIPR|nr:unnamed protein product [Trifolium pratense]
MERGEYYPLFETKMGRGRVVYRLFAISLFVAICLIWLHRFNHIITITTNHTQQEEEDDRGIWVWLGLLAAELWFGFYWILTQAFRWNPVFRHPFKNRLSQRYEHMLPEVDIFVCTADPEIEPPMMVINTVLSVMAYDYPTEKLSVYLSDDGGSEITFYALLEASNFAKSWIPFCKRFKIEPRSPAAYFNTIIDSADTTNLGHELVAIKKLYNEMERRIEDATKLKRVPKEARLKHGGFSQWDSYTSKRDHDTILQRPQYHHNFKAGAMNSLLRVSSIISNGKVILNVDCDMYSNNSETIRDVLCFFMDEKKGHQIGFVQSPQIFENVTKNDIYGNALLAISEVEFHGADSWGGPMYIGTGCFHKRESLCGMKFSGEYKHKWKSENDLFIEGNLQELEEKAKGLANCSYEENTQWGKEMGLKYGCPVEDVITGLSMQINGWKSVYYNPPRKPFLGIAPTSLLEVLIQHKRWSEGDFQILLSKYSPAWHAFGKIPLGLQMGYCSYCLWAANCLATLYYSIIPSFYLIKGISLFPKISSCWFIPFAYVIIGETVYSLLEFLLCGGTFKGWWNEQRIWLYKRTSSYLYALSDTILKLFGFSDSAFTITAKVSQEEVSKRHEKEIMEFGTSSPLFTILATLALFNLFCFLNVLKDAILRDGGFGAYEKLGLQVILCGFLVLINLPLYQGLFLRKDSGKLPSSVALKSSTLALALFLSYIFV